MKAQCISESIRQPFTRSRSVSKASRASSTPPALPQPNQHSCSQAERTEAGCGVLPYVLVSLKALADARVEMRDLVAGTCPCNVVVLRQKQMWRIYPGGATVHLLPESGAKGRWPFQVYV